MNTSTMQYMCNHVVLPPKLPQSDDSSVIHEKELAHAMLESIASFRPVVRDGKSHRVLNAVFSMLKGAIAVLSSTGAIDPEALALVLRNLANSDNYESWENVVWHYSDGARLILRRTFSMRWREVENGRCRK
jgi:hypothetical protein